MKSGVKTFVACFTILASTGFLLSEDKPDGKPAPAKSAATETPSSAARSAPRTDSEAPVIGYIEKNNCTITIKAGAKGPIYSAKSLDGKVMFENLSGEQLRAQNPELHDFLKSSVAKESGSANDARVRIRADASVR